MKWHCIFVPFVDDPLFTIGSKFACYFTLQKIKLFSALFFYKNVQLGHNALSCDITATSNDPRQCISIQLPVDCLFRQTSKVTPKHHNTSTLWGESTGDRRFPPQTVNNAENASMPKRHLGKDSRGNVSSCLADAGTLVLCMTLYHGDMLPPVVNPYKVFLRTVRKIIFADSIFMSLRPRCQCINVWE